MEEFSAFMNRLIPAAVLGGGVIVFLLHASIDYPDFIDFKKRLSTTFAFLFWLVWWVTLLAVYFLLPNASITGHPFILAILDVGDLALLGFAICYCNGDNNFPWKRLSFLPLILIILILFYAVMHTSLTYKSLAATPLFSLWLVSPSAVLANVAILMFGWAFFVRWGFKALPLFAFTTIYALAQLPAYIAAFVVMPDEYEAQFALVRGFSRIGDVFPYLALGKVILALYPFILFLSPDGFRPGMSEPKYWPSKENVNLHPNVRRALLWILTALASVAIGAINRDQLAKLMKWLGA